MFVTYGRPARVVRTAAPGHDCVADVVGRWARACHFWLDYQEVGGLALAAHRHVLARLFRRTMRPIAPDATLGDFAVE